MYNIKNTKNKALLFSLFLLSAFSGNCQYNQKRLDELREKYPWGSIYITYVSLISLSSILGDQKKLPLIRQQYDSVTTTTLNSFLTGNRRTSVSEAIAFIQIDLIRIQAGYKRASDAGGEINPIAWTKEEVVNIADLCDKQMNSLSLVKKTLGYLSDKSISIDSAYAKVMAVEKNYFSAQESDFIVSKDFWMLLNEKDNEYKLLKNQKPDLYVHIEDLKSKFYSKFVNAQAIDKQISAEMKSWKGDNIDQGYWEKIITLEALLKDSTVNKIPKVF